MFGKSSAYRGAVIRWEIGLLLGFLLLGAFSVSRSLVVAGAIEASRKAERNVDVANETKLGLELLISRIKDAETGQRGYLLTQDPKYLEAYDLGVIGYQSEVDRLWSKLQELNINGSEVTQLRDEIHRKYDELLDTINLAKEGKHQEALAIVKSDRGKRLMDAVRSSTTALSDRLNISLAAAKERAQNANQTSKNLNFLGGVISVFLFILVFWLSWRTVHFFYADREQKARRASELDLAVKQRTLELNQAKEELEAFSYSVSHDLRGPLRAVISYAGIVQEDYGDKLDAEGNESLERIKASGRRMSELIDTLLALSRLSRTEISIEPIDASQLCENILGDLAKADENKDRGFHVTPGMTLYADRKMLTTLLENLLRNAWKFSSRSSEPKVEVGVEGQAVYIRDNGVGFNPDYANKLFLPFQRLHNDREFEGTGIGLAIVDRIVKRHGGRAWAEAEEGKGATFFFQLAAAPEVDTRPEAKVGANGR